MNQSAQRWKEEDPSEPTIGSEMDTTKWIQNILSNETTEEHAIEPTSGIPALSTRFYEGSTSGLPIFSPVAKTVGSYFPEPCLSLE